jgi:hypothetical protein
MAKKKALRIAGIAFQPRRHRKTLGCREEDAVLCPIGGDSHAGMIGYNSTGARRRDCDTRGTLDPGCDLHRMLSLGSNSEWLLNLG